MRKTNLCVSSILVVYLILIIFKGGDIFGKISEELTNNKSSSEIIQGYLILADRSEWLFL